MTLSLRHRIVLTLMPLLLLLTVIGTAGVVLLSRLGNSVNTILRENYDSVIAMERLNEAVERIDSSFQFAISGRRNDANDQYHKNWPAYDDALAVEQHNVTLPGEVELVDQLVSLTREYRRKGDTFHAAATPDAESELYYRPSSGLLAIFTRIKDIAGKILHINQDNMKQASRDTRHLAITSLIWFAVGLAFALLLAAIAAWHTVRTTLRPIQAMTEAAIGISAGNLDQVVPYLAKDELGELAKAFNTMTRHLRDYRQSQSSQLLRVQQTSQATVDSFPDPVIVVDSEGAVEIANPAARRLLGVLPKRPGQTHAAIWQPPESLRLPLAKALQHQQDYAPEGFDRVIVIGANGHERAILPRILTIRDPYGNLLGAAVLLQDVTRLRLLDQVKSNLVATASHELKTPLTSVRMAVHLLLEETVGPLTAKQTELLVDARENTERLLAMVNNLLDLARLEQGMRQLNIQPERPESLLRAAADAVRSRADDLGVDVAVELPQPMPAVAVDVTRLANALQNLLDNALTYTPRGGRITLAAAPAGDTVSISVSDTGIGIPAEYLPHVFEKFFRVPGRSQGSGTGLGLAIVHEIVTAQGGTIRCESVPNHGTAFHINLPIATDSTFEPVGGSARQGEGVHAT
jgi:PAS domain S-box-containing protein